MQLFRGGPWMGPGCFAHPIPFPPKAWSADNRRVGFTWKLVGNTGFGGWRYGFSWLHAVEELNSWGEEKWFYIVFVGPQQKINWRICCCCFFCLKVLGGMGCKLTYFSNNSRQEPCCLNVFLSPKWPVLLGKILWDIFLAGCSHTSNMKAFAGLRRISWIICHLIEGDSWSSKKAESHWT